jgi:hypothetical protein
MSLSSGTRLGPFEVLSATGAGRPHPLHDSVGRERQAELSPDGQRVAFSGEEIE